MSLSALLNEPYNQEVVIKKLNIKTVSVKDGTLMNAFEDALIDSIIWGKVSLTKEQLSLVEEGMYEISLRTYLFTFRVYSIVNDTHRHPLNHCPINEAELRELNQTFKNPVIEKFLMNPDFDFLFEESKKLHHHTMYLKLSQVFKKNLKKGNLFKVVRAAVEIIPYLSHRTIS